MAPEPHEPAGGCIDCGTFLLDCACRLEADRIEVVATPQRRQTAPEVESIIESTWLAELHAARHAGRRLYDGHLHRLVAFTCAGGRATLTLGPVSFKEFLGTNLTHAYLRYLHGPDVLADALGVSAAVCSRDGFVILGRRSQQVASHAGRVHPLGDMVEGGGPGQPVPHPAHAIARELLEETALPQRALGPPICLGLVRDKHIVQPEMIFDVSADADAVDILRLAPRGPDGDEHAELLPVRDHPAAVVSFIEQNYSDLTPVAMATLLLHGLGRWGGGWFATTRGYLRSVI